MRTKRTTASTALLVLLVSLGPCIVMATENGSDNIGKGSEGFSAGMLPEPGWYGVLYANYYYAAKVKDGHGNIAVPGFKLSTEVIAGRIFYMTDVELAGGRMGFFGIGSLVALQNETSTMTAHRNGVGDVTVGPTLGWDLGSFHPLIAMDIVVPVGGYDRARALNPGGNYYSVRPIFAFTNLADNGLEVSAKFTFTYNFKNRDTDYRSGQIFHFDYSASYPVTHNLRLGVNGYYLDQTTDDIQHGMPVNEDGHRGKVAAIGPALHYQFDKVGLDFKVLKEFGARNRAQGSGVWAKAVLPF